MMIKVKILFIIVFLLPNFVYAQEKFIYKPEDLRDPFLPLVSADGRILESRGSETKTGVAELYLEGIIFDPKGNSFVLISGKVYKEKDVVSNYRINKINENSIIVVKDDVEYRIALQKKYDIEPQKEAR